MRESGAYCGLASGGRAGLRGSSRSKRVATSVAGAGAHAPETDGRGTVTIGVDSDDVLPDVVARLRAAGIAVEEFSLHLPSLDEVFFTLTGTRSAGDTRESSEVAA